MKLSFQQEHKSILSFQTTEISTDFVVITGINGAGKTHLLEAIENGAIKVDGIQQGSPQIRRFHHSEIKASDNRDANPSQLWNERQQLWPELEKKINSYWIDIRKNLASHGITSELTVNRETVLQWTAKELIEITGDETRGNNAFRNLSNSKTSCDRAILKRWTNDQHKSSLAKTLRNNCPNALLLNNELLEKYIPLDWKPTGIFQQNFAALFASYHRQWECNRKNRFYATVDGSSDLWLSNEEFVAKYGGPPWETINLILAEANLPLEVNYPTGDYDQPFILKLHHKELDKEIQYTDLSSGEKIIISLAHCLYYANSKNSTLTLPKLLLLDEPDAPLHPSMARSFMNVIERVLVKEKNVKVIMTTHSPSSVVFAPEGSVYRLDRQPRKLTPCTTSTAVSLLTDGFSSVLPTSRFVIVESKFDEETYQSIFKAIQQQGLWPDKTGLTFVRASDTNNSSGGGCSQVSNWSEKLSSLGLPCFRGLIDKDSKSEATDAVNVLNRYSIENYLLDPILIYACLIEKNLHEPIYALEEIATCNIHTINDLENETLQKIANVICNKLELYRPELKTEETFSIYYVNGKEIQAPAWLKNDRGHDLEQFVINCFKDGKKPVFHTTHEELVRMVTAKLPGFISTDLVDIFTALAS